MKKVRILYDCGIGIASNKKCIERNRQEAGEECNVNLEIDLCEGYEVLQRVEENEYNFLIIHLGGGQGWELYRRAERAKRISPMTVTVAETAIAPCGSKEIEEHFDYYIEFPIWYPMGGASSLRLLLGKYILTEESS